MTIILINESFALTIGFIMKNTQLTICNATIHPGETANLALPLPELYSCASFYMPIKIIHGKEQGPCVLLFSTLKGDELNGLEIIQRLVQTIKPETLKGTLITIPVFNVYGLVSPNHENRLKYCFPGSASGSYNERLAHVFTQEILCKAHYCIELQTGSLNHELLPQIYCNIDQSDAKKLAYEFSAPVITNIDNTDNSLRRTIDDMNIPLLVYLAGEAMRFNEAAIKLGVSGTLNVLNHLDMLENAKKDPAIKPIFSKEQDWFRAHRSGILFSEVELGQMIHYGQRIGYICDPFSASDTAEVVKAIQDGIVVGINRHPLIHEGQTIFKVASFIDNNRAELALGAWGDMQKIKVN